MQWISSQYETNSWGLQKNKQEKYRTTAAFGNKEDKTIIHNEDYTGQSVNHLT